MSPSSAALAYRLWCHCDPLGWDCTMGEAAAALDVDFFRIRGVCRSKGWSSRFRATRTDAAQTRSSGMHVAVDGTMGRESPRATARRFAGVQA